ncbi:MAG TPA: ADP compounds hydrolase NudE [Acidiferrobacterales bacterium]|nr:ADP compounds hydrolase NudE [Acidiferrobacterales bacterium]
MASNKKPEITGAKIIAQTRLFRIERLDLRFSNGREAQYERLHSSSPGAVLMVPMLDANTVLLIREYAAGVDRYELALPKGRIESGETPQDAANRELMEEIGYGAKKFTPIKSVTLAPGYLGHTTHMILAEELYPERRPGDEPEAIEVVPWSLDNLPALLALEECTEARSIAALFMVRQMLTKGGM